MARISIGRGNAAAAEFPSAFSFDQDDDMADPSSLFDFDLALPLGGQDFHHRASSAGHRPSKSSSDSKDFDFKLCMSTPDLLQDPASSSSLRSTLISPADELFYKGKLLPLYMSERLHLSKNVGADLEKSKPPSSSDHSSIAVSCYLHRAGVDINMVLEEPSDESSRESSRNSREKDSSSSGGEEDSSSSSSGQAAVAKNSNTGGGESVSGRFRWSLLSLGGGGGGGQRRSSKVTAGGKNSSSFSTGCDQQGGGGGGSSVCKSCGQRQGKSMTEARDFSTWERKRFDTFSSSPHAGLHETRSRDKFFMPRHSTGAISSGGFDAPTNKPAAAYQSLLRAKEFWRKYLKPFISRTSQHHRSYIRPPEVPLPVDGLGGGGGSPSLSDKSSTSSLFFSSGGFKGTRQRPSRSTTVTPIASPTHSGVLLAVPAPVANDHDVQGAIAYCKQSRAS
ncbi:uncharacterized protein LOC9643319 [Selaginella moellendorffii]|uniref:uncharacterized protein LOC9643319 n=1 Tax=Selaginella moellendorffii TaxID=88036 RepID=UPI000D1C7242|nr:uncharacterized protein LOC9643319 [Selaginella moellendorffii]|eukprot:XP_024515061.1 uncharacterized protein LOC9643319 [Selaginella moellendorffii]